MNTNETYYPDLITRYLSGESSPEEIRELSDWIQADPLNAAQFDEYRKTWLRLVANQVDQQVNLDDEWGILASELRFPESHISNPKSQISNPKSKTQDPTSNIQNPTSDISHPPSPIFNLPSDIPYPASGPEVSGSPLRYDIRYPASDSRPPWQVYLIRTSLIAAIMLVLMVPTWIAYRYFTKTDLIMVTASAEMLESVLPDGSRVSLNAYSSLTYTENYGKTNRDVTLSGEGYFEVNRDSLIPFIISSGTSRVEVLGTSFYVDAHADAGNLDVVLVDGSVAVYFEEARSTGKTIIPGEKAELNPANQKITITPNEDPNFLAWKTHRLIFLDDRLDRIIATLNKVYQSNISLASDHLASCRLTATFDQQSLESVLNVIEVTLDIQAETTTSGIILYGKGCD